MDSIDEIVAHHPPQPGRRRAAKAGLMERFGFTDKQAQAILDMRLAPPDRSGTGASCWRSISELEKTIAYFSAMLADEHLLLRRYQGLRSGRFAISSATTAAPRSAPLEGEIDMEDLIARRGHGGYA